MFEEIKDKIKKIREKDLGDNSLKRIDEWLNEIKRFEEITTLQDIEYIKIAIGQLRTDIENIEDFLLNQVLLEDKDLRIRLKMQAEAESKRDLLKSLTPQPIDSLLKEIEDNYLQFYGN